MADRRRINGPPGSTIPVVFARFQNAATQIERRRGTNELRKTFLQTGIIPSAAGSAYFELENTVLDKHALTPVVSTIKLSCAVHGPKPVPRTASFSPNLLLTASVKFAPFATRVRRGYIRDTVERDLGLHLENALKGAIIPDRWPKSALEVAVTVLEGEEDLDSTGERITGVGLFNILAGCINVASAALVDAKIDCLDLLSAGVAALVKTDGGMVKLMDPGAAEPSNIVSTCLVGYLPGRDEAVEVWTTGSTSVRQGEEDNFDDLLECAIAAAKGAHNVLREVLLESLSRGAGTG